MPVYAELEESGRVLLSSDMPYRDQGQIKDNIAGARYVKKTDQWTVPCTWAAYQQLYGAFGDQVQIGPQFNSWVYEEYQNRIEPSLKLRDALDAEGDPDLFPYQRAGVAFMRTAKRALLTDPPGAGKTVQTIRAIRSIWATDGIDPFPAIVVAPKNMTITWKREFDKWFPGLVVTIVKGNATQRRKAIATPSHVYVVSYEGLKAHSRLASYGSIALRRCQVCDPSITDPKYTQAKCHRCDKELNRIPFTTVVADEAHRLQDPKSQQTRAVWAIQTDATKYVFGLTGTPVTDQPDTMWGALHLVAPDEHPSKTYYIDRYCYMKPNLWSQGNEIAGLLPQRKGELFAIIDPRLRRMPKDIILPHLPPKTTTVEYIDMDPKQAKAYKQLSEGHMALVDGGVLVTGDNLGAATRLTQFASAYAEMLDDGSIRMTMPSNKVAALLDKLHDLQGEAVAVFAQSKQLIEMASIAMKEKGLHHALVVGGQTEDQRDQQIRMFQEGKVQYLLGTIGAGGEGITLTRASTMIRLQRSWSNVQNIQVENRIHRIGSEIHEHINIIDFVSNDTLEVGQLNLLALKNERLQEILRDPEMVQKLLHGWEVVE